MESIETFDLAEAIVCRGEYTKIWECVARQPELREPGSALWRLTKRRFEDKAAEYAGAKTDSKEPSKKLSKDAYSQISYAHQQLIETVGGLSAQYSAAQTFLQSLIMIVASKPHLMDYTSTNEDFGALRNVLGSFYSREYLLKNAAVAHSRELGGRSIRWKKRRLRELFLDINVHAVRKGHEAIFQRNANSTMGDFKPGMNVVKKSGSRVRTPGARRDQRANHPINSFETRSPKSSVETRELFRLRREPSRHAGKQEITDYSALSDLADFYKDCALRYSIGEQVRNSLRGSSIPLEYLQELVVDIAKKNEIKRHENCYRDDTDNTATKTNEVVINTAVPNNLNNLGNQIIKLATPANRNQLSITLARSKDGRYRLALVPWRTFLHDYVSLFCKVHNVTKDLHRDKMFNCVEQQLQTAISKSRFYRHASNLANIVGGKSPDGATDDLRTKSIDTGASKDSIPNTIPPPTLVMEHATKIYELNHLLYAVAVYRKDSESEPNDETHFETLIVDDTLIARWKGQAKFLEKSGKPAQIAIEEYSQGGSDSILPHLSIKDLSNQYCRYVSLKNGTPQLAIEAVRNALTNKRA